MSDVSDDPKGTSGCCCGPRFLKELVDLARRAKERLIENEDAIYQLIEKCRGVLQGDGLMLDAKRNPENPTKIERFGWRVFRPVNGKRLPQYLPAPITQRQVFEHSLRNYGLWPVIRSLDAERSALWEGHKQINRAFLSVRNIVKQYIRHQPPMAMSLVAPPFNDDDLVLLTGLAQIAEEAGMLEEAMCSLVCSAKATLPSEFPLVPRVDHRDIKYLPYLSWGVRPELVDDLTAQGKPASLGGLPISRAMERLKIPDGVRSEIKNFNKALRRLESERNDLMEHVRRIRFRFTQAAQVSFRNASHGMDSAKGTPEALVAEFGSCAKAKKPLSAKWLEPVTEAQMAAIRRMSEALGQQVPPEVRNKDQARKLMAKLRTRLSRENRKRWEDSQKQNGASDGNGKKPEEPPTDDGNKDDNDKTPRPKVDPDPDF